MMRQALLLAAAVTALAACSDRSGNADDANDFANRVGGGTSAAAPVAATPGATSAVKAAPHAGANVFAMEKLGDIGGVDLGPRAGGCTFSENGTEMLIAAGPADRTLPGKAAVRIGGQLLALDAPPGGIATIKAGTIFTGEGFKVQVSPTGPGHANLIVMKPSGESKATAGDWICA